MTLLHGLIPKRGLSEQDIGEIIHLAEIYNSFEHIEIKLNCEMLKRRPLDQTNDYLYYDNGQLVGFLGKYQFRSTEVEISGMVLPPFRRKGIFRSLLNEAVKECKNRKVPKVILICNNRSQSGKGIATLHNSLYPKKQPFSYQEKGCLHADKCMQMYQLVIINIPILPNGEGFGREFQ